jgi:hypothetical protein
MIVRPRRQRHRRLYLPALAAGLRRRLDLPAEHITVAPVPRKFNA